MKDRPAGPAPAVAGHPPLLVLVGPTGVGKTAVAVQLAQRLAVEAINADSRQIYRGMDIGTGKPTAEERARLIHHLIDIARPDQRYQVARFRADALQVAAAIRARGRLPLVVGGTGLYVRALLKGLRSAPPADPALRVELEAELRRIGPEGSHRRLAALDPGAAARLHPRDRVRIVRALEVRLLEPRARAHDAVDASGDWAAPAPFRLLMAGLAQERNRLNARLADRVRDMVARGIMEEVEGLLAAGYSEEDPGMDTIGYRQFAAAVRGALDREAATRLMVRDTQRYAKRQMTWFRRDPEIRWLDVDAGGLEAVTDQIARWAHQEGLIE